MVNQNLKNNVVFAIGTGRCGTQFLAKMISHEPMIASIHESNSMNETFHRYCKWYNLPVDNEGFLRIKEIEIQKGLTNKKLFFEASAFLSVSIKELYEHFGAKFILLVRSPEKVVNSYLVKGWYNEKFVQNDKTLALGYQQNNSFHHFLGRPAPVGEFFNTWNSMTRVGKLSWYWNELNSRAIHLLNEIPKDYWIIKKIEEMNYDGYQEVMNFLDVKSTISSQMFNFLSEDRHSFRNVRSINSWSDLEIHEFESQVQPMTQKLNYEYKVNKLLVQEDFVSKPVDILANKVIKRIGNIVFPGKIK